MNRLFNPKTVVGNLLLMNVVVFLIQYMFPRYEIQILENFALFNMNSPFFRIWQPVSYMFLHGNFSHLFFNMFALWMFGRQIEYDLGQKKFVTYYFATGIGAALINMLVGYFMSSGASGAELQSLMYTPTVGASGAVFGLLLAFGMLHPDVRIMLLIPPVPIKAKWFVVIYGVIELLGGVRGGDNIAHFAHLGGMIFGFALLIYWRKARPTFRR
ncbi:MAG: rhomboid family intramembrane serine protease [Rikenellaceae bacterium]